MFFNIKEDSASQGINDTNEMSVIFHCVRFRVSGIIHNQLNPINGISGLVNKSYDQDATKSERGL